MNQSQSITILVTLNISVFLFLKKQKMLLKINVVSTSGLYFSYNFYKYSKQNTWPFNLS